VGNFSHMTTLRGIAQPSDCLLIHMLLAYWRKLLKEFSEIRQEFIANSSPIVSMRPLYNVAGLPLASLCMKGGCSRADEADVPSPRLTF
jgi:hypothetical protein